VSLSVDGSALKSLTLAGVGAYRRYVSPRKGFACAMRVHRGGQSCSAFAERVIRRFGVRRGVSLLQRRLARCGDAHRRHHAEQRSLQRGSCDLPCDIPCDGSELMHCDITPCDCADCGGNDDKKRKRESRQQQQAL
jgi:uncharacterized protein